MQFLDILIKGLEILGPIRVNDCSVAANDFTGSAFAQNLFQNMARFVPL